MGTNTNEKTVNISAYLRQMAAQQPYKRAVVAAVGRDKAGRVTYTQLNFKQLDRESDCIARGLDEAGIKRGVRTILMVKPSLEFFALTFALFKVGAVPVVVDPGMGIKRMLSCFQECSPRAFIGIPLAHVVRTVYPKFFKSVRTWVGCSPQPSPQLITGTLAHFAASAGAPCMPASYSVSRTVT